PAYCCWSEPWCGFMISQESNMDTTTLLILLIVLLVLGGGGYWGRWRRFYAEVYSATRGPTFITRVSRMTAARRRHSLSPSCLVWLLLWDSRRPELPGPHINRKADRAMTQQHAIDQTDAATTTVAPHLTALQEIKIYSHSTLLYWWPAWVFGF